MLFPSPRSWSSTGASLSPPGPRGKTGSRDLGLPRVSTVITSRALSVRVEMELCRPRNRSRMGKPSAVRTLFCFLRRGRWIQAEGMRGDSSPSHLPAIPQSCSHPPPREKRLLRGHMWGQEHRASQAPLDSVLPFQLAHGQCQSGFGGHGWAARPAARRPGLRGKRRLQQPEHSINH